AVGPHDLDHLPVGGERDRDLARLGLLAAHIGVDLLQELHLLLEADAVDRVVVGIEQAVGAARAFVRRAAAPRAYRFHGGRGALQCLLVERRGMGETCDLALHGAQAEALRGVEGRALQLAVVERQALALDVFEEQLAVVAARQRLVDGLLRLARIERSLGEEDAVGGGEMVDALGGHGAILCQTTRTILPKWALAFMCASASAAWESGKVLSIGRCSLPASIAGHRSARAALTMARTSSGERVRKVTPI